MIWICYSPALERQCLLAAAIHTTRIGLGGSDGNVSPLCRYRRRNVNPIILLIKVAWTRTRDDFTQHREKISLNLVASFRQSLRIPARSSTLLVTANLWHDFASEESPFLMVRTRRKLTCIENKNISTLTCILQHCCCQQMFSINIRYWSMLTLVLHIEPL